MSVRALVVLIAILDVPGPFGCKSSPPRPPSPPAEKVATATAPGPDAQPAGVELRLEASSPKERERLQAAVALFRSTCTPMVAAWPDVESATARQVRVWESSPWAKLGWGEVVQVQVKLRKQPFDYRIKQLQAGGFTLHWAMGGGKKPGIEAALLPSRKLCDITGTDGWRSLPAAASLGLSDTPAGFSRAKKR